MLFSRRSGETRTRGLDIPNVAPYQLGYTPMDSVSADPARFDRIIVSQNRGFVKAGLGFPCGKDALRFVQSVLLLLNPIPSAVSGPHNPGVCPKG